jgi:hypothetical protein
LQVMILVLNHLLVDQLKKHNKTGGVLLGKECKPNNVGHLIFYGYWIKQRED